MIDNNEALNLQKTINETNLNLDNDNVKNNYLNIPSDNYNNHNCLTLGNLDNSPRTHKEEFKERRKESNLIIRNNRSEFNKNIRFSDLKSEDNEISKLFDNKRESSKTHKSVNGKVSFLVKDANKSKSFLKEDQSINNKKKFNSYKNGVHIFNNGLLNYNDYKVFFYLTFESIKLNTQKNYIFEEIDVDKLYKYSLIHSIPFYKVR